MKELAVPIISAFSGIIIALVPAYLIHVREVKKHKLEIKDHELRSGVLDRILDIVLLNDLKVSAHNIFKKTKADRFLILIAINGKVDFRTVSVIFEQHKNSTSSAIASYKNLRVDMDYVNMLKKAEKESIVILDVDKMEPSLLKEIYLAEGVKHSRVRHLLRKPLDNENHCLIYSSIATHEKLPFTEMEKIMIQTQMDSIIKPTIEKMLKD